MQAERVIIVIAPRKQESGFETRSGLTHPSSPGKSTSHSVHLQTTRGAVEARWKRRGCLPQTASDTGIVGSQRILTLTRLEMHTHSRVINTMLDVWTQVVASPYRFSDASALRHCSCRLKRTSRRQCVVKTPDIEPLMSSARQTLRRHEGPWRRRAQVRVASTTRRPTVCVAVHAQVCRHLARRRRPQPHDPSRTARVSALSSWHPGHEDAPVGPGGHCG